MPQGKWEISKLLDEFEKELLSRERINLLNSENRDPDPPLFSGSTLHLQAQKEQPKTNQILCTYCKQNHPSNKCSVVTDIQAREQILISKTRCFNCLPVGHVIKNCTKPQKCYICQGKHHISICNSKIQNPKANDSRNPVKYVPLKGIPQQTPEQETEEASVNQVISPTENLIQNENYGNDTFTTLYAENSHAQKNVLLQTSQALVSSVNSTSKGQRRVLFDNCY